MKLWWLHRTDKPDYDGFHDFLVAAPSQEAAWGRIRENYFPSLDGDEEIAGDWETIDLEEFLRKHRELHEVWQGEVKVLISAFNAG